MARMAACWVASGFWRNCGSLETRAMSCAREAAPGVAPRYRFMVSLSPGAACVVGRSRCTGLTAVSAPVRRCTWIGGFVVAGGVFTGAAAAGLGAVAAGFGAGFTGAGALGGAAGFGGGGGGGFGAA